jgi:hypothetical protein
MEKGRPGGNFKCWFNLVSPSTSIRDWSLNKGKPDAAGHIVGQYRSKKICYTYIRSGGSNRYCGKTQIAIFTKKKEFYNRGIFFIMGGFPFGKCTRSNSRPENVDMVFWSEEKEEFCLLYGYKL